MYLTNRRLGVLYICSSDQINITMNNFDNDFPNEKEKRREKFKKKHQNGDNYFEEDDINKRKNISKKELKKIKESYQEEEWEDWDRYYNH